MLDETMSGMDRTTFQKILGSALVVILLPLAIAGLQFYGVIHAPLGRLCFYAMFFIGSGGIIFSEGLSAQEIRTKIFVGIVGMILWGLCMGWLDRWARAHAPVAQPPQIVFVPAPLSAPPKSPPKAPPIKTAAPCTEDESRPYKCKSGDELIGLLAAEQAKLLSLADDERNSLRALPAPFKRSPGEERAMRDDVHRYLADQIRKCCIRDLTDIRAEAIKRIGLPRIDLKEAEAWEHITFSLKSTPYSLGLWPETVMEYSAYITKMEQLLSSK